MDFDDILDEIGEFGRFQLTNYLLICLPVIFSAANSLSYVFTAGIPEYRCLIDKCDNIKNPVYQEPWINYAVPGKVDVNGLFTPEQCKYYEMKTFNSSIYGDQCTDDSFTSNIKECTEWVFSGNENTIVQEWGITCPENQWKLALVGTMHFAGILFGSALFGVLADRYGRKSVFIVCTVFMAITGIGQAISTSYTMFLIFAFFNAIGTSGVYPLAFIIGVEMVGRRKREMSGMVLNYFYAVGEAAVGLSAWLCHDWTILQLLVSVPPILFVFYYWLVPESVRWLLARKHTMKAERIIRKAAKVNGVVLSESLIATFNHNISIEHSDENDIDKNMKKIQSKGEIMRTFRLLFQSRVLLTRSLILFYVWTANAFVYYGLSLNSTNLSGNKYVNFALVCLVEIPGYSLAWIAMNKVGRRWSLAGSLLLCGLTCVAGGFLPTGLTWAIVTLFLIGKLGITASFGIIYVHTAEMLPTIVRSCGVGTMSTVARIGAMLAPFVPLLNSYYEPLPLLLFGSVSFVAGLLALFLPETLGRKLPDTAEEAELLNKDINTNDHKQS